MICAACAQITMSCTNQQSIPQQVVTFHNLATWKIRPKQTRGQGNNLHIIRYPPESLPRTQRNEIVHDF